MARLCGSGVHVFVDSQVACRCGERTRTVTFGPCHACGLPREHQWLCQHCAPPKLRPDTLGGGNDWILALALVVIGLAIATIAACLEGK